MKQFIICPECRSIELAQVESRVPARWDFYRCTKCKQLIPGDERWLAKAISIKQPWAYLIASGTKDVENRTWKTNFRGRVLIHVGAKVDNRQMRELFTTDQWYSFFPSDKTKYMLERKWQTSATVSYTHLTLPTNREV